MTVNNRAEIFLPNNGKVTNSECNQEKKECMPPDNSNQNIQPKKYLGRTNWDEPY